MRNHKIISFLILLFSLSVHSQKQEIGKTFIQTLLVEKNYEKAFSFFDDELKKTIPLETLKDIIPKIESQVGSFKTILEFRTEGKRIIYYSEFDKINLDIILAINQINKIESFNVAPHKEIVKEENGLGNNLNIKSNTIELKGTLVLAKENNQKKIVIFVHGSGPNDRNETTNVNKPFKDIAEGLYKLGISSYRFDKRTYSNPESFTDKSTIDDEVVNDVLNIVDYIKKDKQFEGFEIIVLGHSLGAYLMPRIANNSTSIDRIIMMAGNSRSLDTLVLEQYNYLYALNPTPELKEEIDNFNSKRAILLSKDFNLNTPKDKLPLELSANYWKSLLDYKPLIEVKKIKIPILVLQGERDYQVTMKDFSNWKKTLKRNKKANFISYPKLNHLFLAGEGDPNPNEYSIKGEVDSKVINDINTFLK